MICACMACRGWKEADKLLGLCIGCGGSEMQMFDCLEVFFEHEIINSPDHHLLSMIECNNKFGTYNVHLVRLKQILGVI